MIRQRPAETGNAPNWRQQVVTRIDSGAQLSGDIVHEQAVDALLDSVDGMNRGVACFLLRLGLWSGCLIPLFTTWEIILGKPPDWAMVVWLLAMLVFFTAVFSYRALTRRIRRRLVTANELCAWLPNDQAVSRRFRLVQLAKAFGQPEPDAIAQLADSLQKLTPDAVRALPDQARLALRTAIVDGVGNTDAWALANRPESRVTVAALLCLPHALAGADDPLLDWKLWSRIRSMAKGDDPDPGAIAARDLLRALKRLSPESGTP